MLSLVLGPFINSSRKAPSIGRRRGTVEMARVAWYDPYGIFATSSAHRRRSRLRRPPPSHRSKESATNTTTSTRTNRFGMSSVDWLLRADYAATDWIWRMAGGWSGGGAFRTAAMAMEWSMHGLLWMTGLLLCIYAAESRVAGHLLVNLLGAIVMDLVIVGLLKTIFRRRRPRGNPGNMVAEAPYVDQFSFPSGHTSRAAMLTKLLITLSAPAMSSMNRLMVCVFPMALGVSRVMLGRHYVSDVLAGVLLGLIECDVATHYWLTPDTCAWFRRMLRREV